MTAKGTQHVTVVGQGTVEEVPFKDGMTLEAAIKATGMRAGDAADVRVNGQPETDMALVLKPNDQVQLLRRIRGAGN